MEKPQRKWRNLGFIVGAAYGLFARFAFGFDFAKGEVFGVMTSSFILGMPVVLGFLTLWFDSSNEPHTFKRISMLPWLSSIAMMVGCLLLAWEGIICVLLWLPLTLILSSFGGFIGALCRGLFKRNASRSLCVAVVALLPFAAAPLENLKQASTEIRTVNTHIEIKGSAADVWQQIKSVPKISKEEQRFSVSHLLGFPEPTEAVLVGTGVGAVRMARFEGNVLFVETITEWEENQHLSFKIRADTANIPPTTFDEHVTIGGPFFDVLEGTYRIEQKDRDHVVLHLSSNQRLSTRFNFYSHLWTEYLMADLQNYILKIIKTRVERGSPQALPLHT